MFVIEGDQRNFAPYRKNKGCRSRLLLVKHTLKKDWIKNFSFLIFHGISVSCDKFKTQSLPQFIEADEYELGYRLPQ